MPRHTHPRGRHRHSRAHVRRQQQRAAAKRWRQIKTLDAVTLTDLTPRDADDDRTADQVQQALAAFGVHQTAGYAFGHLHPEVVWQLPESVRSRLRIAGRLGAMTDRSGVWQYCNGCAACRPYRHLPGYRTMVRRSVQEEIDEQLADWERGERTAGRRVSANRQVMGSRGWC